MGRKKGNQQQKPLKRSILLDLGEEKAITAVAMGPDGRLIVMGPEGEITPVSAEIETSFETGRPDKPKKVVSRAVMEGASPFHHIDLYCSSSRRCS